MTIIYLRPENFFVNENNELCNNIDGFSFVIFTSKRCVICKDILPIFIRLSNHITGCTFVEMDVDQNQQKIRSIAAKTSTPIDFVPYILFYVNGRPTARYIPEEQSPHINFDKMKQFLLMQSQKDYQQVVKNNHQQPSEKSIPDYSIGKPICSKNGVCYHTYNSAYKK